MKLTFADSSILSRNADGPTCHAPYKRYLKHSEYYWYDTLLTALQLISQWLSLKLSLHYISVTIVRIWKTTCQSSKQQYRPCAPILSINTHAKNYPKQRQTPPCKSRCFQYNIKESVIFCRDDLIFFVGRHDICPHDGQLRGRRNVRTRRKFPPFTYKTTTST